MNDTIAAISTGTGGAIAVIRLSGGGAIAAADKIFTCKSGNMQTLSPRMAVLGEVRNVDGILIDRAMLIKFCAPHSYTGEDVIEIHCHGGNVTPARVLDACLQSGVRLAESGEFSRRAVQNGKMDLSAAEGVADLIAAESEAAANAALTLSGGALFQKAGALYNTLIDMLAELEAGFDYPEEDLSPFDAEQMRLELSAADRTLAELEQSYAAGRAVRDGVSIVLTGRVNAGKSSLLNALTGTDRAIVTDIAGTTTDTVSEAYIYKGIKFNVTDTAGIRAARGTVEQKGIERASRAIAAADIIVVVRDLTAGGDEYSPDVRGKTVLTVFNKSDAAPDAAAGKQTVSALTGAGIAELKERILSAVPQSNAGDGLIITNARHYAAVRDARTAVRAAIIGVTTNPPELTAIDISEAVHRLGQITGKTASADVISAIFSKFCLGK